MNKKLIIFLAIGILLFCILAAGFSAILFFFVSGKVADSMSDKANEPTPEFTQIVYIYQDASVEPSYHRSYSIKATPQRISVKIDSYGEVLEDEAYDLTEEEFAEIVESLKEHSIHKEELGLDTDGCPGGSTERIAYTKSDGTTFSASLYHCQVDSGDLAGDVRGFAYDLKSKIPNFESLINNS